MAPLPTLDLKLKVNEKNMLEFRYYEKPTTCNTTVLRRSAMEENPKHKVLGNDLIRRFLNTEEKLLVGEAAQLIDDYSVKLLTSGYSKEQTVRIIVGGLRGYESRVRRCVGEGRSLYRTAAQSARSRLKKKLLGKTDWYKKKRKPDPEAPVLRRSLKAKKEEKPKITSVPTSSVMFVGYSPNGELAKNLREEMLNIEKQLGFRFRIVEKCGTPLKLLFSPSKLWEGVQCGRDTCIPCKQGGEVIQNCTRRSIVYENICLDCNPAASTKGEIIPTASNPSIYVGESSRSLAERTENHWKGFSAGNTDNHILKHHQLHHGGVGTPNFVMKMVKQYPSALRRQVGEAVRIRRRGPAVLNSQSL